ncbi:MAG: thioredoxin-family protein [Rhizorhabdus sp.]|nr:thioredoxin-family protein [Rhizorhabdus sp.]
MLLLLVALMSAGAAPPTSVELRDGSGAERPLPAPAVLLFWAAWCAPCRAEIRDLPAIRRAAAPLPVIVVATEGTPRSRALLQGIADDAIRYPADASVDVMPLLPGGGAALPAAMARNADGAVCGMRRGRVTEADLAEWRVRCTAPVAR